MRCYKSFTGSGGGGGWREKLAEHNIFNLYKLQIWKINKIDKDVEDILVLHGEGAHELPEEWEDELVQRTFGSTLTTLSKLQLEKDEGLGRRVLLDHSTIQEDKKYFLKITSHKKL